MLLVHAECTRLVQLAIAEELLLCFQQRLCFTVLRVPGEFQVAGLLGGFGLRVCLNFATSSCSSASASQRFFVHVCYC